MPNQNAVILTDQELIVAARTAFDGLTTTQQSLVTNTHKLTTAEIALSIIKALPSEDIVLESAFGNAAGDTIILKLSTVVNATYGVRPDNFQIIVDSVTYPVYSANYDPTDSHQQTIILTLSPSVLLNASSVVLSIQDGAFVTGNMKLNNTYTNIPILTFNDLDHNQDHSIGIDDVVQLIGDPNRQVDVNQDGEFDKFDIRSMLGQISMVIEQ